MFVPGMVVHLFVNLVVLICSGFTVFGRYVEPNKFPWIVTLYNRDGHFCIGSIISNRLVVTSASCVEGRSYQSFRIRVGSVYHLTGGYIMNLDKVIVHPDYDPDTHNEDIAVLITIEEIDFNKLVKPLPLARTKLNETATGFVMGWKNRKKDVLEYDLQYARVNTMTNEQCFERIDTLFLSDRMVCTQMETFNRIICKGDDGGPLVINETLHGVLSWGSGCKHPDIPAIFTSVHYYYKWIESIAAKNDLTLL